MNPSPRITKKRSTRRILKPLWIRAALLLPHNHAVTHRLVASRKHPPGGGIPDTAGYAPGWELQRFPEGTRIRITAGSDNSALSPHHPDSNRVVCWGQQLKDEMKIGFFILAWN